VLYATDESVDTTSETNTICWLIEFKQKKKKTARLILLTVSRTYIKWNFLLFLRLSSSLGLRLPRNKEESTQNEKKKKLYSQPTGNILFEGKKKPT